MNSLTTEVGLKVGPTMLEVLVRHYFDRLKKDVRSGHSTRLKEGDVLFDEAFTIVKSFLNASTLHTVEELQGFSNTRTPSPPWVHVVRSIVPMSCCEEAANYLIKAFGGEDVARRLVGGVKWWQVRGVNGVDAQWITAKKDWQEAKRKHKMQKDKAAEGSKASTSDPTERGPSTTENGTYEKEMDAMRCILYLHGGGYYFGSVDQERYSIQRHARKINGRVFAINYRLAPQYPFPCALQDAIAAYLFLIQPPPGSEHEPVKPAHIVIAGDSAGGGLSLALLQVIRDSGLPAPAGGILISPWCDLSHSFPSIHLNTDTDIIPESGLSFHKPSILWPPPTPEVSTSVHASIRFRIRQTFKLDDPKRFNSTSTVINEKELHATTTPTTATGSNQHFPSSLTQSLDAQQVNVTMEDGELVQVAEQLHFYTQNHLITHPLVSPALSYLGGLPPLMFIEGDKEVLRDEGIFTAHKAAHPEKYPISDEARALYPALVGIEQRYKPTSVHLQVYDDAPHVLPVLFSFTTPSKFCFRAMANFVKLVTEMNLTPSTSPRQTPNATVSRRASLLAAFRSTPQTPRIRQSFSSDSTEAEKADKGKSLELGDTGEKILTPPLTEEPQDLTKLPPPTTQLRVSGSNHSLKRSMSARLSRAGSYLKRSHSANPTVNGLSSNDENGKGEEEASAADPVLKMDQPASTTSSDVAGPRFQTTASPANVSTERTAGEPSVYAGITNRALWECGMIRERVSTTGVIRPLEPEHELGAFQVKEGTIGTMSPAVMRRYLKDRARFEKKFHRTIKGIDKHRKKNLQRAKEDTIKRLGLLQQILHRDASEGHPKKLKEKVLNGGGSPNWGWAWALDEHEAPPPSSIASRRDTDEAQALAQIADQAILGDEKMWNANTLWGLVMSFLTVTPGKDTHVLNKNGREQDEIATQGDSAEPKAEGKASVESNSTVKRSMSRLSRIFHRSPHHVEARASSTSLNANGTVKRKSSSHHHLPLPHCLKEENHEIDDHGQTVATPASSVALPVSSSDRPADGPPVVS
ncbi:hypothetical protein CVT24_008457 [Panaeolus cyanescens]|uniref:Alpha/beta hydrolase fold-3 domain-containing protein n=1 Tax=Panaeolus cyanescens TaxID=181874 RepID=A0A409VDZ3_9AGAR|nr:hypothetical protein CVT24_008457 [Panaeolus cyanescens]